MSDPVDYSDKYREIRSAQELEGLTEFWTALVDLGTKHGFRAAYVAKSHNLAKVRYLTWNFYYDDDFKDE